MNIIFHERNGFSIAEINADGILIDNVDEALQLFMDLSYQGTDRLVIYERNITPAFFELRSGFAGALLQKCVNYKIRLAIVGDFDHYPGQSLRDFIFESNQGNQAGFLPTVAVAIEKLSR
ncbi:DUF4180 domain-containing protein [Taibaiella koreensis]|uniref:DUF4180 domain-containing protein n=1 Tax=Taibaiella koreensis TaxID=1268548 RepID=UPI000E59F09C|nr:DUF4180 domain-containing protein [Taibaiella koreensis]